MADYDEKEDAERWLEEHSDDLPPEELEPSGDVSYEELEQKMEDDALAEEKDDGNPSDNDYSCLSSDYENEDEEDEDFESLAQ